jgi:anti-sigma factor RsiW
MNQEHVSDERIQAFLDGQAPAAEAAEVERHLASCPACSRAAADYRRLFDWLATEPEYRPAGDLAVRVMERLPARRPWLAVPAVRRSLLILSATAVLVTPFLFVDARPLLGALDRLAAGFSAPVSSLLASLGGALGHLPGGSPLWLFALLAFAGAGAADHFLKQRWLRHS